MLDRFGHGLGRLWDGVCAFLKQQFDDCRTTPQIAFDFAVGVIAVPLGLIFDPGLFNSYEIGVGGEYQLLARTMVPVQAVALVVWLLLGKRAGPFSVALGGILLVGGLLGTLLLVALTLFYPVFPMMVVGLLTMPFVVVLGALGVGPAAGAELLEGLTAFIVFSLYAFIPFAATFICFRNAVRAFRLARKSLRGTRLWVEVVCLVPIVVVAGPLAAYWHVSSKVNRCIRQLRGADPAVQQTIGELKKLRWVGIATFDRMVYVYFLGPDNQRSDARLARAYQAVTDVDIQDRWNVIGN